MLYLTLIPSYTGSPLRLDDVGEVVPEEVGLSWELGERLRDWNARYKRIIPLGDVARRSQEIAALIVELDEEGLRLAAEIAEPGVRKVQYYSEGLLRRLP